MLWNWWKSITVNAVVLSPIYVKSTTQRSTLIFNLFCYDLLLKLPRVVPILFIGKVCMDRSESNKIKWNNWVYMMLKSLRWFQIHSCFWLSWRCYRSYPGSQLTFQIAAERSITDWNITTTKKNWINEVQHVTRKATRITKQHRTAVLSKTNTAARWKNTQLKVWISWESQINIWVC